MQQVIVLTHWFDPTADTIVRALQARGVDVFRCDAADFPQRLTMAAELGPHGWTGTLCTEHRSIDLSNVTGAYYRRPSRWEMPKEMTDIERDWATSEAKYGFGGLLSATLPWLNHPAAIARAEYKPVQLHAAAAAGLAVLPTLLTNDPRAVLDFATQHGPIIYKTLAGELVADGGDVKAIYTTPVAAGDYAHPSIAHTAHLFQRQVATKRYDVRVTAIDGRLFAAAVHAGSVTGHLDWRRDYDALTYEPIDIPAAVADGVHTLMRALGLRFGALDFAVTTGGEWLFYEVNPSGQLGVGRGRDRPADQRRHRRRPAHHRRNPLMESRELFPLGRGIATLTPRTDPPSGMRPFGMRQAVTIAPAIGDDTDGLVYDHAAQVLALAAPTGDPHLDAITLAKKTTSTRATDRDGSKPTTPKDFNTDTD